MLVKKIIFVLALWFLLSWAYREKLKPFIQKEFGLATTDSVAPVKNATDTAKHAAINDTALNNALANIQHRRPVPGMNSGKYVYGIDISHYEHNQANYLKFKQDSIYFVICKATEGVNKPDSAFPRNWREVKQKKFIRGAYHFYKSHLDPLEQAAFFFKVTGAIDSTDFPPMLDIEDASVTGRKPSVEIEKNILVLLVEMEKRTGRRPIIYTNYNIGHNYLRDTAFAKYPLWIAYYSQPGPKLPAAWKNKGWAMWQKSESYVLDGFKDDYDIFNGALESLKQFITIH